MGGGLARFCEIHVEKHTVLLPVLQRWPPCSHVVSSDFRHVLQTGLLDLCSGHNFGETDRGSELPEEDKPQTCHGTSDGTAARGTVSGMKCLILFIPPVTLYFPAAEL